MPVIVETFQQYDPQLKDSLDKIYLNEEFCPQISSAPAQHIENSLKDPHCTLLGARFNGKLIGAATLEQHGPNEFELQHFCIRELTRRRGAGRQFMRGIITFVTAENGEQLICRVNTDNTAGMAFITQAGFTPATEGGQKQTHSQPFSLRLRSN